MNKPRFVIDTTSLISYFPDLFNQGSKISAKALSIIDKAFADENSALIVVPSVVFVEIFDKWFSGDKSANDEFRARFNIDVFQTISKASNFEIRELDNEILEKFVELNDSNINLENRDKIILASAMVLEAPIITSDGIIIKYISKHKIKSSYLS